MPTFRMSSGPGRTVRVELIAVDLDGTILTPEQKMTRRAVEAVRSVRARGIPVIPATSRGVLSVREVLPFAPFGPLVVCGNGAVTIDQDSGSIIRERPVNLGVAYSLIKELRIAIPGVSLAAETTAAFFGEAWIMKQSMRQSDNQVVSDTREALAQAPLKLFAAAPGTDLKDLASAVTRTIEDRATLALKESWIELCAPGVTKAAALDEVSSLLGTGRGQVLAVGDADNDLDMLEWAGISAAVQNAVPSVLSAADFVIPSNSHDGVSALLEELVAGDFTLEVRGALSPSPHCRSRAYIRRTPSRYRMPTDISAVALTPAATLLKVGCDLANTLATTRKTRKQISQASRESRHQNFRSPPTGLARAHASLKCRLNSVTRFSAYPCRSTSMTVLSCARCRPASKTARSARFASKEADAAMSMSSAWVAMRISVFGQSRVSAVHPRTEAIPR
jgi:Cof subfamily protein (haloacid dehalogenase superfamily)